MPQALRRSLIGALFVLLASWAWLPVFQSGLHGAEVGLVAQARSGDALFDPAFADGHALAALDLRAAALLPPWAQRLDSALWLLLASWLLGRCARRLLQPWSGGELARAAGWATSLLFALHPLSAAALAALESRGQLMALAFGAGAVWAYVRGRQERQPRLLALAAALAISAGLSDDGAFALVVWIAGAEYLSARRQRKPVARVRAALAAAGGALGCVSVDTLARSLARGEFEPPSVLRGLAALADPDAFVGACAFALERLGTLLLPVNAFVVGGWGFALAGFVALAALQPILVAARSAPRLWGRILGVWAIALLVAELFGPAARVNPKDLRDAAAMLGSAAVLTMGLGLGAVALSGPRRVALPLVLALGSAALSHAAGVAHRGAAREFGQIVAAVERADAPQVWVIDPPEQWLGVRCAQGALEASSRAGRVVEGLDGALLTYLACTGELSRARSGGLTLVTRAERGWAARRLPAASAGDGLTSWYREGRSPELDLDPLAVGALVVRATADADTARPPVLAWRSSDVAGAEDGRLEGAWAYLGEAPEAVFDLRSSPEWLAAPRIRQVWSAEGWSRISQAEFTEALPEPQVSLSSAAGQPVTLAASGETPLDGSDARRSWTLVVFDRASGKAAEHLGRPEGALIRFDAPPEVCAGPCVLEARVSGLAVERLLLPRAR